LPEPTLKVLMLAPTPYFADRGCHVRILEEARALRALGMDVRIVTYHLGRDMADIPTYRIPAIPWYKKLTAGPSWHKPYLDILLFFKALRLFRSFKADLIHAHLHEGAFVGLLLKKMTGIPLLFDCQGSLTAELVDHDFIRTGSPLFRVFRFLERVINNNVDYILTSSGAAATALVETWGVPETKVTGLIDGVNTVEFRPGDREAVRRALQLPLDRPVAVFLGVLNSYQGVDILLAVAKELHARGVPVHFLVMGFPEAKYRQRAAELALADCLTFTGRIDYQQAPWYLAAGDVAISPKISLTEANGKLFNYMACGLPCVVFDTPVNREILGDSGVYARYGDAADFADQLQALLTEPARRQLLTVQVRQRAVQEHSWQARGQELVGVYEALVRNQMVVGHE
jgi:glycosyltransferase involved in cell wall biosynthesis